MNLEWVPIKVAADPRGVLFAAESRADQVPFDIRRVYVVCGMSPGQARGFHAHKETNQFAFCVAGSLRMILDDGIERQTVVLESGGPALVIRSMIWHEMHDMSRDCVFVVVADSHYEESDYLRDFSEFKRQSGGRGGASNNP